MVLRQSLVLREELFGIKERPANVFHAVGWLDTWHKFYVGSGVIRRDPVVAALKQSHGPFTWSELRRDGKISPAGTKVVQVVAEYGWIEGLGVPIQRGDQGLRPSSSA